MDAADGRDGSGGSDGSDGSDGSALELIHVWMIAPERLGEARLADAYRLLTAEERERHGKFVFERHRREYLVTRGLVRAALSRHRAVGREVWAFRRNEYGRPELEPPCGLRFNLSNHPSLVVCAVRESALDLGCDLEPLARGAEVLGIAETVFAPRELTELQALPEAARPDRAIALWTLKEAYIKARSIGLTLPLREFAFAFPEGAAPKITFTSQISDVAARWRFAMLDLEGCRISLALERELDRPAPALLVRVSRLDGFDENAAVTRVSQVTVAAES
jgi:4'-phosphopantetheinyl transferase